MYARGPPLLVLCFPSPGTEKFESFLVNDILVECEGQILSGDSVVQCSTSLAYPIGTFGVSKAGNVVHVNILDYLHMLDVIMPAGEIST